VFSFPFGGGDYRWTGLFIPYAVGTRNPNIGAAAESQGISSLPVTLDLTARRTVKRVKVGKRRVKRVSARLSGFLGEAGLGRQGATVDILAGGRRIARVRTNANGEFRRTVVLRRTTTFQARATAPSADTTGTCIPLIPISVQPLITPACTGVTEASLIATSNRARVRK
jgi:hypothetical protein